MATLGLLDYDTLWRFVVCSSILSRHSHVHLHLRKSCSRHSGVFSWGIASSFHLQDATVLHILSGCVPTSFHVFKILAGQLFGVSGSSVLASKYQGEARTWRVMVPDLLGFLCYGPLPPPATLA